MRRYQSILVFVLGLVSVVLVSCGGSADLQAKAPTYTPAQLETIQQYVPKVVQLRDRMVNLSREIQQQDWSDVISYIHGPLGELRVDVSHITRELSPQSQEEARQLTRKLFDSLNDIDQAAQAENYRVAIRNYAEAKSSLDQFLNLIPQA